MGVADESQIYRDLMRFKPDNLTPNAWAVQAGVSRAVWADMRRHGNPSRRTLEKLLTAAGSSLAEFEALRISAERPGDDGHQTRLGEHRAPEWGQASGAPLPLVASSLAGEWAGTGAELTEIRPGTLLDRLPRPPSLAADPHAYAVTVVGDAMWPRFRPGRKIAVSPRSPVAIGADVLVKLGSPPGDEDRQFVLITELVKRTASAVELRQFNPELRIEVATADFQAIHAIVGELI